MELGNRCSCPVFTVPGSARVVKQFRRDCDRVFPFTEKVKVLNVIMREKVTCQGCQEQWKGSSIHANVKGIDPGSCAVGLPVTTTAAWKHLQLFV